MDDINTILLAEMRELRKDIKDIRKDLYSLKTRVAIISAAFGILGAYLKIKFL